jgi:hypothetical protein
MVSRNHRCEIGLFQFSMKIRMQGDQGVFGNGIYFCGLIEIED